MHPAHARFFRVAVAGAQAPGVDAEGRARSAGSRSVVGSSRGAAADELMAHSACLADLVARLGSVTERGGVEGAVLSWVSRASSEPEMEDLDEMGEFDKESISFVCDGCDGKWWRRC